MVLKRILRKLGCGRCYKTCLDIVPSSVIPNLQRYFGQGCASASRRGRKSRPTIKRLQPLTLNKLVSATKSTSCLKTWCFLQYLWHSRLPRWRATFCNLIQNTRHAKLLRYNYALYNEMMIQCLEPESHRPGHSPIPITALPPGRLRNSDRWLRARTIDFC